MARTIGCTVMDAGWADDAFVSHDLKLSHATVSNCGTPATATIAPTLSEPSETTRRRAPCPTTHNGFDGASDGFHDTPTRTREEEVDARDARETRDLKAFVRDGLACHPVRSAMSGKLPESYAFARLASEWGRGRLAAGSTPEDALSIYAYAVITRVRSEALSAHGASPARVVNLLGKMALPSHGMLNGGAVSAQARAALAGTLVAGGSHLWDVLAVMSLEQCVEFHTLVVYIARSLEVMWPV